jgi:hypothetical protein
MIESKTFNLSQFARPELWRPCIRSATPRFRQAPAGVLGQFDTSLPKLGWLIFRAPCRTVFNKVR